MSMESFYGGRQGASFVIVKTFDGIGKEVEGKPKVKYFAIDNSQSSNPIYLIAKINNSNDYDFIERNENNYLNYNWEKTICNGDLVITKKEDTLEIGEKELPELSAESMVACFEKGGETTNEVSYGEYVLIDTPDKSNPDNGKVFLRGMDYNGTSSGSLAGAKYIGQIVGPKGDAPQLKLKNYNDSDLQFDLERTVSAGDLVPGFDGSKYNDTVHYKYVNFKDEFGDLVGYYIGFQTPYTVIDFTASSGSPYETTSLIKKNTSEDGWNEVEKHWTHPYYQKWDIQIPRGIHGEDIDKLEVVYTKTKPKGFGIGYENGVVIYSDAELTQPIGTIETEYDILREGEGTDYEGIYDTSTNYCKILYQDNECYVNKKDCHKGIYRYIKKNYDNSEIPTLLCHYINLDLFDNVYLQSKAADEMLPGTGDQKIHIRMTNGNEEKDIPIGEPINYIMETLVIEDSNKGSENAVYGHLLVYFSDPELRAALGRQFPDRIVAYPSLLYEGQVFDDWFDLGQTRGDRTMPILTTVNNVSLLYENGEVAPGKGIPPEDLQKQDGSGTIDNRAKGWGVAVKEEDSSSDFYFYDYDKKYWINSGTLDTGNVDPRYIIAKSTNLDGNIRLNIGGIWLAQETITYADID